MENTIRVQDDLYLHVNKEAIDAAIIPDDKPAIGGFINLSIQVEDNLTKDFNRIIKGGLQVQDPNFQKALDLFKLVKNVKKRNSEGFKPVQKIVDKLLQFKSIADLNRKITDNTITYAMPFEYWVSTDMQNSQKHCLCVAGPSTILPDTTYYGEQMKPQHDALMGVWTQMTAKILKAYGFSEEEVNTHIQNAVCFDQIIASLVLSREQMSEYTKLYNPMPTKRVITLLKPIKFKKVLTDFYGENIPEQIIVYDVKFLKGFKTLFNEENFDKYISWALCSKLLSACKYLSEELRDESSTYQKMLSGLKDLPTIERQAYSLASSYFGAPIGLYYGKLYFGEKAKQDVTEMVQEIIQTYKKRIAVNEVLQEETKQRAIKKLDTMGIKMGYPEVYDEIYDKLNVNTKASLYTVICEISNTVIKHTMEKLHKPVDRDKWVMDAHVVNACYNPTSNDITFPAAILQPPFYSLKQTRSENLGGIGAVIGHEISHAFDSNGAKIDENGNLNNWWTKEDYKMFDKKVKAMVNQFDGLTTEHGAVNAKLTVSENIADNGGMAVTLDIMSTMPDADYEKYFYNWAKIWFTKQRPQYAALLLNIAVHGPNCLRANIPPRNFEEWYKTFNVQKTDKMYIAPNKRVVIW